MRCEEFQERLEEFAGLELPAPLHEHAAGCPACQAYERDWRVARAGLRLLAAEPVPDVSVGFAARLVRQLEEVSQLGRSSEEFLERVGRRFVYASLLAALTVLLFLLLPSSGPLRAPTTADLYFAGSEAFTAESDPVLTGDTSSVPAPTLTNASEGGEQKQK